LDAPSENIVGGQYVDVTCQTVGNMVRDNATWIKSTHNCYFPGGIFDENLWIGEPINGENKIPSC
jgi:hypothetical protein